MAQAMTPEEIREARLTAIALVHAWAAGRVDHAARVGADYDGDDPALMVALTSFGSTLATQLAHTRGITVDELLDGFTAWAVSDAGGKSGPDVKGPSEPRR